MLKAAVIGVGSMGSNHARIYHDMENVELVAVMDSAAEMAAKVGKRFCVPAYTDLDALLESSRPNLVSIAVPTSLHYEVACKLIKRGIHVLIEKPITNRLVDAEHLIELAKAEGSVLAVGHIERFNPAVAELARQLKTNKLGRIYRIFAQRLSPYPPRIQDSGVVIDLASHDIDLIRYLIADPVLRVYGETTRSINSDREDMFNGLMRFCNGAVAILDVNWMTPAKIRTLTITGARGMFVCNLLSQELCFYENGQKSSEWDTLSILHGVTEGNMTGFSIKRYEPLAAELADFVNAIVEQRPPMVSGEDGLETLRQALEFVRSGETGEIIHKEPGMVPAR
jgi:predicted dehydrogenase